METTLEAIDATRGRDWTAPAVARLRAPDGRVVGAGCVLPGGRLLTCAHVVNDALGRPRAAADRPTTPLSVEFPLGNGLAGTAVVLPDGWNRADDVALLAFAHPPAVTPLRLLKPCGAAADLWDHHIRAYGFPDDSPERGVWASGRLRDSLEGDLLQINRADDVSPFIVRGFSGGPIWDEALEGVIGMVVQAHEKAGLAACRPTAALVAALPALGDAVDVFDPLTEHRAVLAEMTATVDLRGVPLPRTRDGQPLDPHLPLERVYVRLRAVQQESRRRADEVERQAIEAEARRAIESGSEEVYFQLVDRLGEYLYALLAASRQDEAPVDPEAALAQHQRLVILGPPGAGKSTLLRYLAGRVMADPRGPVPLLVSLGQYATVDSDLITFVLQGAPARRRVALQKAIGRGDVLWLLDALDEARDRRDYILAQLRDLPGRLVLTSRPLDYTPGSAAGLAHFELLPLAAGDVDDFLANWFGALAAAQGLDKAWANERAGAVKARLAGQPALRPLLGNPLLLTFVAVLAGKEPAEELPAHRAGFYRRYLEELLDSWEAARRARVGAGELAVGPLRGEAARRALRDGVVWLGWWLHLAYFGGRAVRPPLWDEAVAALAGYFHAATDYDDLRQHEAREAAGDVARFWREAGLLDVWRLRSANGPADFLAFRHLTFQEFAAAAVLAGAWREEHGRAERERAWAFLQPRLHHRAWREPLLLLAGLLSVADADELVGRVVTAGSPYEAVLWRDLRLAAALVGEEWHGHRLRTEEVTAKLLAVLGAERLYERRQTLVDATVAVGSAAIPALLDGLHDKNNVVREAAAAILGRLGDPATIGPPDGVGLMAALQDEDKYVRGAAAEALGRLGDPAAVAPADGVGLMAALQDEDTWVRRAAAEALGQIGDPRAVAPLGGGGLLGALLDGAAWVRRAAAEALGAIGDPAALPALISTLQYEEDWDVLRATAEALGRLGDPIATPVLRAKIQDEDSRVREGVTRALAALGDPIDVPALLDALDNDNGNMRWAAAVALGWIGDSSALGLSGGGLLGALQDEDISVRRAAAQALGAIGDPAALPALLAALQDEDRGVCKMAAQALGAIGDPAALSALLAALQDEDRKMREMAAQALGAIGDPAALPALLAALQDEDREVCEMAAQALGAIGDPAALPALLAALRDRQLDISAVFEALAAIGDPAAILDLLPTLDDLRNFSAEIWMAAEALSRPVYSLALPALLAALRTKNEGVQRDAAESLIEIGDSLAISTLVAVLRDGSLTIRLAAVDVLERRLSDPAAVTALLATLRDRDWAVCRAAMDALDKIDDPVVVPVLQAALQDEDMGVRRVVGEALGRLGDPVAVPILVIALREGDWRMRERAAELLGRLGNPSAVEPSVGRGLKIALQDEDWGVRRAAVEALTALGDPVAVPALQAALQDENKYVRVAAARFLGRLGDSTAVLGLLDVLRDKDSDIRRTAIEALGAIGDPTAVPVLLTALRDGEWGVRCAAAEALGQLEDLAAIAPSAGYDLLSALLDESRNMHRAAATALGRVIPALPRTTLLPLGAELSQAALNSRTPSTIANEAFSLLDQLAARRALLEVAILPVDDLRLPPSRRSSVRHNAPRLA